MEYKDIIKDIKLKNYKNIYLFYGKEFFLIDNVLKIIKENVEMIDFNLDILEETTLENLTFSIETMPFMEDKKIVIVKNFELFKSKRNNFSKKDETYLLDYIKNISEYTVLVFVFYGDIDHNNIFLKELKKEAVVFKCDKPSDTDLFKWVKKRFNQNEVHIDIPQITYFIENSGYREKNTTKTLEDLSNEINKICSNVGKNNKVTNNDIDNLSQRKIENDIFKLVDAIGNKKGNKVLKILNDMLDEGEEILRILPMIYRQFIMIIKIKDLNEKKYSYKEISKKCNIKEFMVSKIIKQEKNFSYDLVIKILNDISDIDYKIKTSYSNSKLLLETFISKYCN